MIKIDEIPITGLWLKSEGVGTPSEETNYAECGLGLRLIRDRVVQPS